MLPATTQEMKCGRYDTVWMSFFALRPPSSLSISAKAIGVAKPTVRLRLLIASVLRSSKAMDGLVRNCRKYVSPIKSH